MEQSVDALSLKDIQLGFVYILQLKITDAVFILFIFLCNTSTEKCQTNSVFWQEYIN